MPDVSWTIQFDAPVDPSSYVHRVGRSARAGRTGNSLVFLTRKEEAYVDFLRLRKVPLRELPDSEVCKPPSMENDEDDDGEKRAGEENEEEQEQEGSEKEGDTVDSDNDDDSSVKEQLDVPTKESAALPGEDGTATKRVIKSAAGQEVAVPDVLPAIRKLVLKDRDVLEKGTKAYTSYIRAYKEHHCGFIFRYAHALTLDVS